MRNFVFLTLLSLSTNVWSQSAGCHTPSPNAKACPTSGTTLLDDTYPVSTYVISIASSQHIYGNTELAEASEQSVPRDFILKVLESYNFNANSPNIVVPSDATSFGNLQNSLRDAIANSNGRIPASIMDKVVQAPTPVWTWQQDYFESFYNPTTGQPVLRNVAAYRKDSSSISTAASSCGVTQGAPLASYGRRNTEMGGNIEGLPGGFCLVGDNQNIEYTRQFCGSDENIVNIETSWLTVGHVDEVFKVIPTNRPGVPAECNFSMMFASPQKAMDLIQEPRVQSHNVFSGDFISAGASQAQLDSFRRSRSTGTTGALMCQMMIKYPNGTRAPERGNSTPGKAKKAFYKFKELLIPSAYAQASSCNMEEMTMGQLVKGVVENPKLKAYNDAVQNAMNRSKETIRQKIYSRLPQCRQYESIIDVPNLFNGTPQEAVSDEEVLDNNGKRIVRYDTNVLPKNGIADSFFPNPTNSVVAGRDLIISDTQNPVFRDYLSGELRRNGVGAKFIDTWDYSHVGNGNIHCSSHSLPYCSPRR